MMMLLLDAITASTSIALRLGAYVFLRWVCIATRSVIFSHVRC